MSDPAPLPDNYYERRGIMPREPKADAAMAEVIRLELRKGSYQMPRDTLPYETQAAKIAEALAAAGYGKVVEAKAQGLAEGMATVANAVRNPLIDIVQALEFSANWSTTERASGG